MTTTTEGRCLCGAYHYQFDREQVVSAHHCHCKDCQKMTGSGKATIVMVPTECCVSSIWDYLGVPRHPPSIRNELEGGGGTCCIQHFESSS